MTLAEEREFMIIKGGLTYKERMLTHLLHTGMQSILELKILPLSPTSNRQSRLAS